MHFSNNTIILKGYSDAFGIQSYLKVNLYAVQENENHYFIGTTTTIFWIQTIITQVLFPSHFTGLSLTTVIIFKNTIPQILACSLCPK